MCISAAVSYGSAAVLGATGLYAVHRTRRQAPRYLAWALVPLFFAIQQAFEGRVWQLVEVDGRGAVSAALGFLFFSHFLWLWWIPLASYRVEPAPLRRRLFLAVGLFGLLAGGLVYFALLLHPEWLAVLVRGQSIKYDVTSPYRGSISLGIRPNVLYALIVLVPLLFSSLRHLRIFGVMIAVSMLLASEVYGHAYISVWCFFAAVLSLYVLVMIRAHEGLP